MFRSGSSLNLWNSVTGVKEAIYNFTVPENANNPSHTRKGGVRLESFLKSGFF